MSGKRYPEEFKIEAVKQVTERGHEGGLLVSAAFCTIRLIDTRPRFTEAEIFAALRGPAPKPKAVRRR